MSKLYIAEKGTISSSSSYLFIQFTQQNNRYQQCNMQVIRKSKKERKSKAAPLIFSKNWISFFQNHNRYLLRIKEGASVVLYTLEKEFVIRGGIKNCLFFTLSKKKTGTPPSPFFDYLSFF